eukprot:12628776-Ditylum_brightwellii.AAC.1
MFRITILLCYLISPIIATSQEFKQWTCDDMTPNLCPLSISSGYVSIRGINIKYWRYKSYNDATSHEHLHQPIIALHGGPSWPHNYMLPLKQLACRGDNEVIFYDQAGCGESTLPPDANVTVDYPHLLDPSYYSQEELPRLIQHLNLNAYHLLGSSWGTILAQLFTLNADNTTGLASLTLSGPVSDLQSYIAAQWNTQDGSLGSLPPYMQNRIHELENKHEYDSAEYDAIDKVLTTYFTLRTAPAPDCFTTSASGANLEIYVGMQGPSEFAVGGVLGDLNLTSRLDEIRVPVLLTSGKYDTMRPSIVETMYKQIPVSEWKILPHSGHVSMIDDAGLMNDVVADFLGRVEKSSLDSSLFSPK